MSTTRPSLPSLALPRATRPIQAWTLTCWEMRDLIRILPTKLRAMPSWILLGLAVLVIASLALIGFSHPAALLPVVLSIVFLFLVALPALTCLHHTLSMRSSRAHYYCIPAAGPMQACLVLHTTKAGWKIADHTTRHPRSGQRHGQALRDRLLPSLTEAATTRKVRVFTIAVTPTHALLYRRQAPALRPYARIHRHRPESSRTLTGGVHLHYVPEGAMPPKGTRTLA